MTINHLKLHHYHGKTNNVVADNKEQVVAPWYQLQFKLHGNWTGPQYSAGRFYKDGERITEKDMLYPAVDALDARARIHDWETQELGEDVADMNWILSPPIFEDPLQFAADQAIKLGWMAKYTVGFHNQPPFEKRLVGVETNPGPWDEGGSSLDPIWVSGLPQDGPLPGTHPRPPSHPSAPPTTGSPAQPSHPFRDEFGGQWSDFYNRYTDRKSVV